MKHAETPVSKRALLGISWSDNLIWIGSVKQGVGSGGRKRPFLDDGGLLVSSRMVPTVTGRLCFPTSLSVLSCLEP